MNEWMNELLNILCSLLFHFSVYFPLSEEVSGLPQFQPKEKSYYVFCCHIICKEQISQRSFHPVCAWYCSYSLSIRSSWLYWCDWCYITVCASYVHVLIMLLLLTCDDNTKRGSRMLNQRRSLLRKDCKFINLLIYLSLIS